MKHPTIVDAGPLVAFLNSADRFHRWASANLATLAPPLLTCEAVLSEACFLVRHAPEGPAAILELVRRGIVKPTFRLLDEDEAVTRLITRYSNVPMSLADGCLVRLAELNPAAAVFTLDGDFRTYRKNGRQVIPLIIPSD